MKWTRLIAAPGLAGLVCGVIFTSNSVPPARTQQAFRQAITLTYIDTPSDSSNKVSLSGDPFSVGQLIGGQFNVNSCQGGPTKVYTDQDWQDGRPVLNDTFDDSNIKGADLGTSFDGELDGHRVLFFLPGDINNLNADNSMALSHSGSPNHFLLRFLKETRGPNRGSTFLFGKGNHVPFNMGPDNNPQAGVSIAGENYVVFKTGHEKPGGVMDEFSFLAHFAPTRSSLHGAWDIAPANILIPEAGARIISRNNDGGHFVEVALVHHGDYVYMFGTGLYRNSAIYVARIPSKANEGFPTNNFWTGIEPTQYFRGFLINGANVTPDWSETESDAIPLVDDQNVSVHGVDINVCANPTVFCDPPCGQASPHACGPSVGNVSVQFETSLGLWIMTFDGGRQKDCLGDPDQTHGIYFSYAKDPWGPWSTPQMIFNPATDGGFGKFIYNPDDRCNPFANVAPTGGPAGPALNPTDDNSCNTRGDAYGPFMIKRFNNVDPSGTTLSIYYTMSTFNPYTIVLMHSDFKIGY